MPVLHVRIRLSRGSVCPPGGEHFVFLGLPPADQDFFVKEQPGMGQKSPLRIIDANY